MAWYEILLEVADKSYDQTIPCRTTGSRRTLDARYASSSLCGHDLMPANLWEKYLHCLVDDSGKTKAMEVFLDRKSERLKLVSSITAVAKGKEHHKKTNQMDHILINGIGWNPLLEVKTRADVGSDHHLVPADIKLRANGKNKIS